MSSSNDSAGSGATDDSAATIQALTEELAQARAQNQNLHTIIAESTGWKKFKSLRRVPEEEGDRDDRDDDQTLGVDRLPEYLPYLPFKMNEKNIAEWKLLVDITLRQAGIPHLANAKKDRPHTTDPLYAAWADASDCLTGWLLEQMEPDLKDYFEYFREEFPFADVFMNGINFD